MRIVTWNCNRGDIEAKLEKLQDLCPDVVFIQESRKPSTQLAPSQLWRGENEKQGVAAFGFNGYNLRECEILDGTHPVTIPFFIEGNVNLFVLGIWAKQAPTYVKCIWKMVDLYHNQLVKHESLVMGDFNSSAIWDQKYSSCSHSMLVERLEQDFKLVSSYHSFNCVAQGSEKSPTIYWMYKEDRPFHIDYCFIPEHWATKLQDVSVGKYNPYKKLSDHRPLVIDVDLNENSYTK